MNKFGRIPVIMLGAAAHLSAGAMAMLNLPRSSVFGNTAELAIIPSWSVVAFFIQTELVFLQIILDNEFTVWTWFWLERSCSALETPACRRSCAPS